MLGKIYLHAKYLCEYKDKRMLKSAFQWTVVKLLSPSLIYTCFFIETSKC